MISVNITIAPASARQLYQVKHDATPWRQSPEVFRLEQHHLTDMTEAWQWWCFEQLVQSASDSMTEAELKTAFKHVYGSNLAFTNFNGFMDEADPRADFINQENLDAPLPKFSALVCGGNVLAGVENGDVLEVETLNGNNPPPAGISRQYFPWLVQYATIATKTLLADGTYKVIKFPQLNGRDVPVPVLARLPVTFPLSRLIKLPLGAVVPSPYNF